MAINNLNLGNLLQPAVEDSSRGITDIFLGLVDQYGRSAIQARFSEGNPPSSPTTTNTDTAAAEIRSGPNALISQPAVQIGLGVAAILGVALIVVIARG